MPPRRSSRVAKAKAKTNEAHDMSQEAPSSDYVADSDAASDSQDETAVTVEPPSSTASKTRRKSRKSSGQDMEEESPNSNRAKILPVRTKDATDPPTGIVDIVISIPAKKLATTQATEEPKGKAGAANEEPKGLMTPAVKKSGHVRFDNDDDDDVAEKFYTPLEAPARNPFESSIPPAVQEEDEEDSDDDAAPETVSASAAATQMLKSAQATAKIAEQQAASQKRKRQDKDALFKAQAAERKKARASEPKAQEDEVPAEIQSGRQRTEKTHLPALLPAELLESDDESLDGEDDEELARQAKRVHLDAAAREAMLARADRGPADRQVGSTLFRVMKDRGHVGLAPKASKRSQDMRHDLLARRRVGKKMGGGFLVKGRS